MGHFDSCTQITTNGHLLQMKKYTENAPPPLNDTSRQRSLKITNGEISPQRFIIDLSVTTPQDNVERQQLNVSP